MIMERQKISQYEKMTQTPISTLVLKLGIPTTISMLVTSIYNMADTAFVGRLGNSASGATGIIFGFMAILQAVGFMFGQGAGSVISRKLGSEDKQSAGKYASTAFFLALALGLVIEVIGFIFLKPIVMLLGSTETIAPYAESYARYILLAAPFMVSSFVLNNILRFEGKASLAMIGLLTGALLNIAGDPLFMFVFGMGISGAGLATALSQLVSFCILISIFARGKSEIRLSCKLITLKAYLIKNIITTGLPSLLRQGLSSISTMLLNNYAAVYGDAAVAAMSIVTKIVFFVFSVCLGIGQGFQPVSGYNYGAKKFSRVRKAYRFTLLFSELLMLAAAAAVLILSPSLIGLFRNDGEVIDIGTRALQLQCITLLFQPLSVVTEMQLQSTGQKLQASLLSSLKSGIYFIPTLIILADLRGLHGIEEAQPLSYILSFVTSVFFAVWFFKKLPHDDVSEQSGH